MFAEQHWTVAKFHQHTSGLQCTARYTCSSHEVFKCLWSTQVVSYVQVCTFKLEELPWKYLQWSGTTGGSKPTKSSLLLFLLSVSTSHLSCFYRVLRETLSCFSAKVQNFIPRFSPHPEKWRGRACTLYCSMMMSQQYLQQSWHNYVCSHVIDWLKQLRYYH